MTEPFPTLPPSEVKQQLPSNDEPSSSTYDSRPRTTSSGVESNKKTRGQSLVQSFVTSNPPLGMWQATGEVGSKIPTLSEIHDGSFGNDGWSLEGQLERRGTNSLEVHRRSTKTRKTSVSARPTPTAMSAYTSPNAVLSQQLSHEEVMTGTRQLPDKPAVEVMPPHVNKEDQTVHITDMALETKGPDETGTYPNGYRFPKKHTWSQSIAIGLRGFWKFFTTPLGFLITIYGLNVVGWGAMIFFLLIEAAPAMCHPSCGDKYSARNVWIEIDAQVLTALFCVTAFGLIPWRFRDFYYLARWRIGKDSTYHRKLAGIYRSWYRLPGSDKLADNIAPAPVHDEKHPQAEIGPPSYTDAELSELEQNQALPLPLTSIPDPPLTGMRATPTKSWNLDVIIWMYMLNTWIQVVLCGIMWGMNRFDRPSWATGFLISIGCITGIVAGIVVFVEGSKVKKAEGIPVKDYDEPESVADYQKRRAKETAKETKKHGKIES